MFGSESAAADRLQLVRWCDDVTCSRSRSNLTVEQLPELPSPVTRGTHRIKPLQKLDSHSFSKRSNSDGNPPQARTKCTHICCQCHSL